MSNTSRDKYLIRMLVLPEYALNHFWLHKLLPTCLTLEKQVMQLRSLRAQAKPEKRMKEARASLAS